MQATDRYEKDLMRPLNYLLKGHRKIWAII
jgi:hypothetical protein